MSWDFELSFSLAPEKFPGNSILFLMFWPGYEGNWVFFWLIPLDSFSNGFCFIPLLYRNILRYLPMGFTLLEFSKVNFVTIRDVFLLCR